MAPPNLDFRALLTRLRDAQVEFVIVDGSPTHPGCKASRNDNAGAVGSASSAHYTYRLSPGYAVDHGADLGAGDDPLLADLNGDGRVDLGSYKRDFSTFRCSYSPDFSGVDLQVTHGLAGDVPIVADVNGDGVGDIGVLRDAVARWWFLCSPGWTATCLSQSFGRSGDVPIYGKPAGMP